MFSNTRTATKPPISHSIQPTRSTSRRHSSSSTTLLQPTPKRTKHSIKDQRRDLTQSIISNLPRDELEKLLLEAALRDAGVMQEVIRANSVKRPPTLHQEQRLAIPEISNMKVEVERDVVGDANARVEQVQGLEVDEESGESMDAIQGMGADAPLQFHHVTQRQFEARRAKILEILRRPSDQEALL